MWLCSQLKLTDVSQVHTAFIFRVEQKATQAATSVFSLLPPNIILSALFSNLHNITFTLYCFREIGYTNQLRAVP
jgi:hypothetical protein